MAWPAVLGLGGMMWPVKKKNLIFDSSYNIEVVMDDTSYFQPFIILW